MSRMPFFEALSNLQSHDETVAALRQRMKINRQNKERPTEAEGDVLLDPREAHSS
jgi:hypothetical protein